MLKINARECIKRTAMNFEHILCIYFIMLHITLLFPVFSNSYRNILQNPSMQSRWLMRPACDAKCGSEKKQTRAAAHLSNRKPKNLGDMAVNQQSVQWI